MKRVITAKRSLEDGKVSVYVELSANGYRDDTVKLTGRTAMTSDLARELAAELVAAADEADARVAKKVAADERRQRWRDREVAAGRRVVLTPAEFLGRKT